MKEDSRETQFSIGDAKFTYAFRTKGGGEFSDLLHLDVSTDPGKLA